MALIKVTTLVLGISFIFKLLFTPNGHFDIGQYTLLGAILLLTLIYTYLEYKNKK